MRKLSKTVYSFYADGFRSMTIGRTLWLVIFIKLFIIFIVLRLIFFPNFLNQRFHTEKDKSEYVIDQLTKQK